MNSSSNLQKLYRKLINGSISDSELNFLKELIENPKSEPFILFFEEDVENEKIMLPESIKESKIINDVYNRVHNYIENTSNTQSKRRVFSWHSYAAALLLLIFSIWLLLPPKDNLENIIIPGGNKATMTLENGRVIELKTNKGGIIIGERITYNDSAPLEELSNFEASGTFTLTVPKSGIYNVQLSDGSTVWLNSNSKLIYPARFNGPIRQVQLVGEGYFKITSHKKNGVKIPFIVQSGNQYIEVVGTSFNVSAYPSEKIKTTLVEGLIKIKSKNNPLIELHPGEQAILGDDKITKHIVDVDYITSWKEGLFNFQDDDLGEIMKQISRWYNIEVIYSNEDLKREKFGGIIPKDENLNTILKLLEKMGRVKFSISGQEVYITRK